MKLFVYGTLKRGYCRSYALADQQFLGMARTKPRYRLYDCGDYPGLVCDPHGISVEGELWEVDAACLARLDEIEGVPAGEYQRSVIHLLEPFETVVTESYFYRPDVRKLRECGPRWP